jgi:hypothetical protein
MAKLPVMLIIQSYRAGKTATEIGKTFRRTRQRIDQILKSNGITAKDGGAHVKALATQRLKVAARNRRCLALWGLTLEQRDAIRAAHRRAPFIAFKEHRYNASRRGIPFNLTFADWWALWLESGHWDERGRGVGYHGYVMARISDAGAYERGNVRIITQSENMLEFHQHHKRHDDRRHFVRRSL